MTGGATITSRGVAIDALDEIDSTNREAMRRAMAGERGPIWISAQHQLAGRGRAGRDWVSIPGNFAATLLFRPQCLPTALHQLSLVAGVALHDALATFASSADSCAFRLKWPNDVMLGSAKLAGILVETSTFHGETVAAIGIGVNVASAPRIQERVTACMADVVPGASAWALLDPIDSAIARWSEAWRGGAGFATVRHAWLARSIALGTPVVVHAAAEAVAGAFAGIDDDGALLLTDDRKRVHRYTAADVALLGKF